MATKFEKNGYSIVSGGTDNHLFVADVKGKGVDGARLEQILTAVNIATNKNTIPGDKSALNPSGIRLGSPAMTTRGCLEPDFDTIVEFIERAVKITAQLDGKCRANKGNKIADFKEFIKSEVPNHEEAQSLKKEVINFATKFPIPGGLIWSNILENHF